MPRRDWRNVGGVLKAPKEEGPGVAAPEPCNSQKLMEKKMADNGSAVNPAVEKCGTVAGEPPRPSRPKGDYFPNTKRRSMMHLRENAALTHLHEDLQCAALVHEALKVYGRYGLRLSADPRSPAYAVKVLTQDPAFVLETGFGEEECRNALLCLLDLGYWIETPEGLRQTCDVQRWPDFMGFLDLDGAQSLARCMYKDGPKS